MSSSYFDLGMDKKLIVPYSDYLKALKPDFEYVGDPKEIIDVVKNLNLPSVNSVKIISTRGAGSTALMDALAHLQHASFMPDDFMIRPLFKFNGSNLFNTSDAKAIEARFNAALNELKAYSEQGLVKPVLLIDDGCNFVLNAPQHVINKFIEATVTADYVDAVINVDRKKEIEFNAKHPEFLNSFSSKELKEPTSDQIQAILKARAKIHAAKGILFDENSLKYVVDVTQRFKAMYDTAQPNRALRLMDSAATGFHMKVHSKAPGVYEKEKQLKALEIRLEAPSIEAPSIEAEEKASLESQAETLRIELKTATEEWQQHREKIEKIKGEIREFEIMVATRRATIEKFDQETRSTHYKIARTHFEGLDEDKHPDLKGRRKEDILNLDEQGLLDFIQFDMNMRRNPKATEEQGKISKHNEAIQKKQKELAEMGQNKHADVPIPISEIEKVATIEAKTPVSGVSGRLKENLRNGMVLMQETVYGQDHVLHPLVASLRRAAAGLNDPDRPLGNFIIGGPPGTGKTHIGKQIAVKLFGGIEFCEIIDMENFQEKHTVMALLGAPPSFAGYGKKGRLIQIGQEKPFCVLILDEIEKAHPDIRQALLKLKGTGRLIGYDGEEADFRNIVIIETTNYGQKVWANNEYSAAVDIINQQIRSDTAVFSPEYLDRADALLWAGPLDRNALFKIVDREVGKLKTKVAKRDITIDAAAEDLQAFVDAHCLKVSGRQSEIMINKIIGDPLSDILLSEGETRGTLMARFNKESKKFTTEFLRASVQAATANAASMGAPRVM